jgi:ParB family transcriptional regulator, chromosome partitioning protein
MTTSPAKPGGKAGAAVLSSLTHAIQADLGQQPARNKSIPAPTQLMQFSDNFRQQSDELEKLKSSQAMGFKVQLSQLIDSVYHLLPLEESRIQALMENLRDNPLSSPVVVRAVKDTGQFELLAGRHRVEAYRRLGRTEIQAVATSFSDDEAERLVFYDNLFAPSIGDYEKYLGFSRRMKSKGFSQGELAAEAGVSRTLVNFLFSFERLPADAQKLISENPKLASANLFQSLAGLASEYPKQVTEAISLVLKGELPANRAVSWVQRKPGEAVSRVVEKSVIKSGSSKFATVTHSGSKFSVQFLDEGTAKAAKEFLEEYLQEQALGRASSET